jgi:hypothetical protein
MQRLRWSMLHITTCGVVRWCGHETKRCLIRATRVLAANPSSQFFPIRSFLLFLLLSLANEASGNKSIKTSGGGSVGRPAGKEAETVSSKFAGGQVVSLGRWGGTTGTTLYFSWPAAEGGWSSCGVFFGVVQALTEHLRLPKAVSEDPTRRLRQDPSGSSKAKETEET